MSELQAAKLFKIVEWIGYALVFAVAIEIVYATYRGMSSGADLGAALADTFMSLIGAGDAVPIGFYQAGVVGIGMIWTSRQVSKRLNRKP